MDITYVKTTEDRLNSVPVIDGQEIYASDTSNRYSDFNGLRRRNVFGSEIDAITNVYGSKNLLQNNRTSGSWNGVTFTVNANGSVTINGTASQDIWFILSYQDFGADDINTWSQPQANGYILSNGGVDVPMQYEGNTKKTYILTLNGKTFNNITVYPMIRDARITDPTYVPYAMTNAELTKRAINKNVSLCSPTTVTIGDTVTVDNLDKYKEIIVVFATNNNDGYRKTTMTIPKSVINYSAEGQVWENYYFSIFDSPSYYSNLICNFTNSTTLKIIHVGTAGWTINNYIVQVFGSM